MLPPAAERGFIPPFAPAAVTRRRSRFGGWRIGGLLLLGVLVAAGLVYRRGGPTGPAGDPIQSVVVLPFENLTGDPAQDVFADTVTDAITVHLRQVNGLDVISRTSARQYKDSGKRAQAIAHELKVEGVVAGTVIRSAAGVGIRVHLIRAATERDVWSQTYDDDLRHMIRLQQRIASEIAVAAGRPAPPAPAGIAATQAIDPHAYELYLKGVQAQGQERYEGFRRAVAYFEDAVAIQPDFAEAHAVLALAELQFLYDGPLSPHESIPRAEVAARRALQLDDTLSRALVLGRILLLYHWRREEDAATTRERCCRSWRAHRREHYVSWFGTALIPDALGERDRRLLSNAPIRTTRSSSRSITIRGSKRLRRTHAFRPSCGKWGSHADPRWRGDLRAARPSRRRGHLVTQLAIAQPGDTQVRSKTAFRDPPPA